MLAAAAACAAGLGGFLISDAKGPEAPMTDALLAPYAGPHGGVPAFDKIKTADFKPALLKAMDLQRKELAAIVAVKAAPTFENTIVPLEDSGRAFNRAQVLLGIYTSTMADKAMQAVETEMAPILAAYADEVVQNEALFARIKAVYDGRATAKLTPEQLRLVDITYRSFARRGAALGAKEKARAKAINTKLAELYTAFSQNQLADEESYTVVLDKEADLAGLPDTLRASLKAAAEAKGQKGKWLISNTRSSAEPFLTFSSRRDLREKVWKMWPSTLRTLPSDQRESTSKAAQRSS